MPTKLNVNGKNVSIASDDLAMPLLYALRDDLGLHGPRFGCGLGQCGACTVLVDGRARRSCVLPISEVGARKIVTLEGLGSAGKPHALQVAFIEEQAVQCGYCINGMIMVADVEVDRRTGKIRVQKFHVAHDCGQVINPDGLRNQIEGSVVQTVSRTLMEEIKFNRSRVTSVDQATYPILKFPEVPEVAIAIIDRPNEKPWGAGEPTAAVVPAAIANAVYNATGGRMRSVPFTPEKMLAAQKTA